jgi:hypothetical protein
VHPTLWNGAAAKKGPQPQNVKRPRGWLLSTPSRNSNWDTTRIFEAKCFDELREIIGIRVHVVAVPRLAGSAMAAAIMGDAAVAARGQEKHLILKRIAAERPTVTENHGLTVTPILEVDFRTVLHYSVGTAFPEADTRRQGDLTSLARPLPSLCEGSEHAKLLHNRVEVRDTPMLGDPPIDDTHCVNRLEAHLPASRRNAEEVAEMGAVIGLIGGDDITVGLLPMDRRSEVGKCFPQPAVEFEYASLIGLTAWLRRMVMEIVVE